MTTDTICLDPGFSTTRCVSIVRPGGLEDPSVRVVGRKAGGLRARGYFKTSNPRQPLISVIQPVYNAASVLEKSMSSVVSQSYGNVEYIIVDGGSTDGTLELISANEERIDLWISETDGGIYDAMNKGVGLATGRWVYFLGADDVLEDCLCLMARHLRNDHHIFYGDVFFVKKNKVYDGRFDSRKLMFKNICQQAIFYPRSVFQKYEFNVRYSMLADYDLNIRCWGDRELKFKYVPILVCTYAGGESLDRTDNAFWQDKPTLDKQYFSKSLIRTQETLIQARRTGAKLKHMFTTQVRN